MLNQLFGHYLIEKGVITHEDYKKAMETQSEAHVRLGTIAVLEGFLTEEEAEFIHRQQMQFDKRFGDIAVEHDLLREEQVNVLLRKQGNTYMKFLEALLQAGVISVSELDTHLGAFQAQKGFNDADMVALKKGDLTAIADIFAFCSKSVVTDFVALMLRNLTRFVSADIYMNPIHRVENLQYKMLSGQHLVGDHDIYVAIAQVEDGDGFMHVAETFASAEYGQSGIDAYDAVCEFVNCNSGLFASELSKKGYELELEPVYAYENEQITGTIYEIPVFVDEKKVSILVAVDGVTAMGSNPVDLTSKAGEYVEQDYGKKSVMIVDDSKMSRKMLQEIIEEAGYQVVFQASNGAEAVEAYKKYQPDVVTMDITMPVMDGIEALTQIKEYDDRAKVIMVTAAGQQQKIIEALKLGAEQFITKPFEREEVLKGLEA